MCGRPLVSTSLPSGHGPLNRSDQPGRWFRVVRPVEVPILVKRTKEQGQGPQRALWAREITNGLLFVKVIFLIGWAGEQSWPDGTVNLIWPFTALPVNKPEVTLPVMFAVVGAVLVVVNVNDMKDFLVFFQ